MTVKSEWTLVAKVRAALNQVLIVILINVPTVSFGLALGWVSLASGEAVAGDEEAGHGAVVAAVTTFTASLVGVPLSARALLAGRKVALIGTSAAFVICWSLKLASPWGGTWCIIVARVAAGLGGAAAWALAPLLAREMCSEKYRGAAVTALAVAHNFGLLLMYIAADIGVPHRTVLWWCLGLALVHCVVFTFVPESPSFLAANGKSKEARSSLAWFRGLSPQDPALEAELAALPPPEDEQSSWSLTKEMMSDPQRRRAFIIGAITVIGQEACGVLAILQYAERVFVLARDGSGSGFGSRSTINTIATMSTFIDNANNNVTILANSMSSISPIESDSIELVTPARHAVFIGVVQLVMSTLSLYLVEKVGRRPLLVSCAATTGAALAVAAWLANNVNGAAIAIAVAIAADSAGLQPVPYAVLADMFHYQYRSCALMLVIAGACAGNAFEVALFPAAVALGGLRTALILATALTLAYALFAFIVVPETRGKSPEEIYDTICPRPEKGKDDCESGDKVIKDCWTSSESKVCTSL